MKIESLTSIRFDNGEAAIIMKNYKMKYRRELPIVFKGLEISINNGEKVGIVGRTGAGKSSLIHGLLRMAEPEEGSEYYLNGRNAL